MNLWNWDKHGAVYLIANTVQFRCSVTALVYSIQPTLGARIISGVPITVRIQRKGRAVPVVMDTGFIQMEKIAFVSLQRIAP